MENYWIKKKQKKAGYIDGLTIIDNLSPIVLDWNDIIESEMQEIRENYIEMNISWHILATGSEGKNSWQNAFTNL